MKLNVGDAVTFKEGQLKGVPGEITCLNWSQDKDWRVLVRMTGKTDPNTGITRYAHNVSTIWCAPKELEKV